MLHLCLASLFQPQLVATLDAPERLRLEQLERQLARSDKTGEQTVDPYQSVLGLDPSQQNSVAWMRQGEGLTQVSESGWLRADPVIFEPTHNGILCRGNQILHLDPDEQVEIETLFNDYFSEDGLHLSLQSPSHGYLYIGSQQSAQFSTLHEVLGQDLTHHLPRGDNAAYWEAVLMQTQMLLHRSQCNIERQEVGQQTVGGLWFWGHSDLPDPVIQQLPFKFLYTDAGQLNPAYEDREISVNPLTDIDEILSHNEPSLIWVSSLSEAAMQNDIETWQTLFSEYLQAYVEPAIKAVTRGQLDGLRLITENKVWQYRRFHRWRFWR